MALPGILFRRADANDLQRLLEIAEGSPGAPRWAPSIWQQILRSPNAGENRIVLMAESVKECAGFGVLGLIGDDAEIESLAVTEGWRRRGIARHLCNDLLNWARARHAKCGSLEVRVSNAAARALYESLGFREVAVRRGYYRDPEEDAVVMTLDL
jgi:ribosomal-protein-alanine N-acetyltransferase